MSRGDGTRAWLYWCCQLGWGSRPLPDIVAAIARADWQEHLNTAAARHLLRRRTTP